MDEYDFHVNSAINGVAFYIAEFIPRLPDLMAWLSVCKATWCCNNDLLWRHRLAILRGVNRIEWKEGVDYKNLYLTERKLKTEARWSELITLTDPKPNYRRRIGRRRIYHEGRIVKQRRTIESHETEANEDLDETVVRPVIEDYLSLMVNEDLDMMGSSLETPYVITILKRFSAREVKLYSTLSGWTPSYTFLPVEKKHRSGTRRNLLSMIRLCDIQSPPVRNWVINESNLNVMAPLAMSKECLSILRVEKLSVVEDAIGMDHLVNVLQMKPVITSRFFRILKGKLAYKSESSMKRISETLRAILYIYPELKTMEYHLPECKVGLKILLWQCGYSDECVAAIE